MCPLELTQRSYLQSPSELKWRIKQYPINIPPFLVYRPKMQTTKMAFLNFPIRDNIPNWKQNWGNSQCCVWASFLELVEISFSRSSWWYFSWRTDTWHTVAGTERITEAEKEARYFPFPFHNLQCYLTKLFFFNLNGKLNIRNHGRSVVCELLRHSQ